MRLLDADEPAASLAVRATRAGFACLAGAAAAAALWAVVFANRPSGAVGTALAATGQIAVVLAAAIVVLRWRLHHAAVPLGAVPFKAFLSAAAWLAPAAVLCLNQSWLSLPAAAAFAVLAAAAFRALPQEEVAEDLEATIPFLPHVKRDNARRAAGIKAASYLAYGGIALGLTVSVPLAALFVGTACALIAWFELAPNTTLRPRIKASTLTALAVSILAALIPVTSTYGSGEYEAQADAFKGRGSGLHTGVVLLTTANPESQLIAPPTPKRANSDRPRRIKPLSILFTGEYWIFYWPRRRPGLEAARVYGNPLTAAYRSTDNDTFIMEARQPLAAPIKTSCCRAIDLAFDSRDPQPENVLLELVLIDSSATDPQQQSLGAVALPPSLSGETALRFDTVPAAGLRSFDEILVRFHLQHPRELHSARVALKRFDLIP